MTDHTANFAFAKPLIGADDTTWGNDFSSGDPTVDPSPGLNGNWEKLDQVFKAQEEAITALQAIVDSLPDNIDQFRVQIGGLHVSRNAENPATKLGYGTWEAWGMGRALVNAGDNGEYDWAVEEERGSETHQLTEDEVPAHTHASVSQSLTTSSDGAHSHSYQRSSVGAGSGGGSGAGIGDDKNTNSAGSHSHTFTFPDGTTTEQGGGLAHNNIMPSKAAYIWKRLT